MEIISKCVHYLLDLLSICLRYLSAHARICSLSYFGHEFKSGSCYREGFRVVCTHKIDQCMGYHARHVRYRGYKAIVLATVYVYHLRSTVAHKLFDSLLCLDSLW